MTQPRQVDHRIIKWRRWLEGQMRSEVLTAHLHRDVWKQTRAVIDANDSLPPSYWWDFISDLYASTQASAVRRLVDRGSDGVSLRRLIAEVEGSCHLVTLDYFIGMYPPENHQRVAQAHRWWRRWFAGEVGDHVCPTIVSADLNELETTTAELRRYVDQYVAHTDPRATRPDQIPTLNDVHKAIELIGTLYQRYYLLITGNATGVTPQIQGDWMAVFRQPWMTAPSG